MILKAVINRGVLFHPDRGASLSHLAQGRDINGYIGNLTVLVDRDGKHLTQV